MKAQAFALQPQDEVSCYYCMRGSSFAPRFCYGDVESYRRGEAVLAEAGHPPYDGNANYICLAHLSPGTEIWDPATCKAVTMKDYAKLGRPEVVEAMWLRGIGV